MVWFGFVLFLCSDFFARTGKNIFTGMKSYVHVLIELLFLFDKKY